MLKHIISIAVPPLLLKIQGVSCHGKDHHPVVPNLSPSVLAALQPKKQYIPPPQNDPIYACLPDYDLIDGICIKKISEPARFACLGGVLVDNKCQIALPKIRKCPPEYKLDEDYDICTRIVETDTQFYCPKGYYDDGNVCAQSMPGSMDFLCEIGELIGEKCILRENREYIIKSECPEGTNLLEDGNCWKEVETFDCAEAEAGESVTVIAPPQKHHVQNGKKVIVQKGKLGSARLRNMAGKNHVKPQFIPPPPPPPQKVIGPGKEMLAVSPPQATRVNIVSQICSKKVQVDALALIICPPNYVDMDGHCVKETIRAPTTICISGNMKNGVCQPTVKRVPKHAGCPKGGYSSHGKCWKQEEVEALFVCPPTYVEVGDECIGYTENIEYECPTGLELFEDNCIGTIERAPFYFSPEMHQSHSKKY